MRRVERDKDQILIPTKNGYLSIPARGVRANESPQSVKGLPFNSSSMRFQNMLQFVLMIAGMIAIMSFIGYTIAGMLGVFTAFLASGIGFLITSNASIEQLLGRKRVQYVSPYQGAGVYKMIDELAGKARLEKVPALFIDHSPEINAFTVEDKEKAAIVLSSGILNHLSKRELYGVLAHEIAHLKNNDVRIMLFTEQFRRLTALMALFGQILLVLSLPFLFVSQVAVPWITILLLITAPMISLLFQVALSRNREFNADMDAVLLAGDVEGLSQALKKINMQVSFLQKLYAPAIRNLPEILRTHPNTTARIKRLEYLAAGSRQELGWSL